MWKLSVDWQDQPCRCGAGIEELFAVGGECLSLYLSTHETLVDKETSHLPLYLYISRDGKQIWPLAVRRISCPRLKQDQQAADVHY